MRTRFLLLMIPVLSAFASLSISAQTQIGDDIDGENEHDNAGYSCSISANGRILAVGSSGSDNNGIGSGHVRIFEWNDEAWIQRGEAIGGEYAHDSAGRGVALSPDGRRVAVGAYMHDSGGNITDAGQVRVFEWDGSEWNQLGDPFLGMGFQDWTGLGESISIKANRVAVGSPGPGHGSPRGYVRIYEWNGLEWFQLGEDLVGEEIGDGSGRSISLSKDADRIAIGAMLNDGNGDDSGHTRVFEWDDEAWIQLGQDIEGEAARDRSGGSVSLSDDGNKLAVGARYNDGNGNSSGHVRVYEWNGSEWSQVGEDIDGRGPDALSGRALSLSSNGDIVAISNFTNTVLGDNPGFVKIYRWDGYKWIQQGEEIRGEGDNDFSGISVSLSSDGQIVAIGAYLNSGNGVNSGHVRVFDLSDIISRVDDSMNEFLIYPNPTSGPVYLKGINKFNSIKLMDCQGNMLMKKDEEVPYLDLSAVSSGMYYLQIITESGACNSRILKF